MSTVKSVTERRCSTKLLIPTSKSPESHNQTQSTVRQALYAAEGHSHAVPWITTDSYSKHNANARIY